VSIKGSPYVHFKNALARGDLTVIRLAAADLPRVPLKDALRVCVLMAEQDHQAFERAAARWLARFVLEAKDVDLAALHEGVGALDALRTQPESAKRVLAELCTDHDIWITLA
jgi:hypothetical protein